MTDAQTPEEFPITPDSIPAAEQAAGADARAGTCRHP